MIQKIILLIIIVSTQALTMASEIPISQLQKRFNQALQSGQIEQAQAYVKQIHERGKQALATALEGEVRDKIIQIQKIKDSANISQRAKEEIENKKARAQEEARAREAQLLQEKKRREDEENQLKAKAEQAVSIENNKQLIQEIHKKNEEITQLQSHISQLKKDDGSQKIEIQQLQTTNANYDTDMTQMRKQSEICEIRYNEALKEIDRLEQLSINNKNAIGFANSLSRRKQINQSDIKDLISILSR